MNTALILIIGFIIIAIIGAYTVTRYYNYEETVRKCNAAREADQNIIASLYKVISEKTAENEKLKGELKYGK